MTKWINSELALLNRITQDYRVQRNPVPEINAVGVFYLNVDMKTNKLKIVFYCNDTLENIQSMEYYNQDIQVLIESGHDVKVCNKYSDIPLNFDVIFIWWWTYALYPVLLSKLLGRKSIITGVFNYKVVEHIPNSGFHGRPFYQRLLIKLALMMTDVNLFVSKIEYDEIPSVFKLKNFHYFPCAIADRYFQKTGESPREGVLNISWSGKENMQRKGVLDILYALRILKDRGIHIYCSLAGRPGNGYPDLLAHISHLGLESQVVTLGEVSLDKKLSLFAGAKIYLQPSYFEGFGLATAEALASGCCIIACDVGEVKNVLGDGAYYVTPGNHLELANVIEKLQSDSDLMSELVAKGQKRLSELYSQRNKKDSLNTILDQLRK
jgi:glycosyltransferase involved in cell wall biosynthesis